MPRPGNREPSAPPIHMMPDHDLGAPVRERSPPPRYEEAIAQDHPYQVIPDGTAPVWPVPGLPPLPQHQPTSASMTTRAPLLPVRRSQEEAGARRRPNSCTPDHGGSLAAPSGVTRNGQPAGGRGSGGSLSGSARYRSTSPGDMSDGSYDRDSETGGQCEGSRTHRGSGDGGNQLPPRAKKKKRGSGSRIKKGLENIAFFIIQILD